MLEIFREPNVHNMTDKMQAVLNTVAISVIIPVYNVENWLDECIESLVSQTFNDFEVILVDDGSTDDSPVICDRWAKKDSRIRVLHKENEGPSAARNEGILKSKGNYLAFLDADDWLEPYFLEKLYTAITSQRADMAECDVWRVNNRTGGKTLRRTAGVMGKEYSLQEQMEYGYTAIWKCMFRRELFTENHLEFPNCHSEARAIYPLTLCLSNQRVYVPEPLYCYRLYRDGSLSSFPRKTQERRAEGIAAYENLLFSFKKYGLYEQYEKVLQRLTVIKLSDLLVSFLTRRTQQELDRLKKEYHQFINSYFPELSVMNYLNISGYNLNRILGNMGILHDPSGRFNFSSLVSLMHPIAEKFAVCHKNQYRQFMVEREIENAFWSIMEDRKPDFIIIDFMEERFDLIEYKGGYLTNSDAFEECEFDVSVKNSTNIIRNSEACTQLWQDSALAFIRRMEEAYSDTGMILVKNYLSEKVGDIFEQKEFANIEEIRKTNQILREYYTFFCQNCRKVRIVEASECNNYFTDKEYEYGAVPSHLNELVNREIAERIEKSMGV